MLAHIQGGLLNASGIYYILPSIVAAVTDLIPFYTPNVCRQKQRTLESQIDDMDVSVEVARVLSNTSFAS
jgi:hypothetical protein